MASFVQQNFRVELERPDLEGLPNQPLPPGYTLRWFHTGDAAHWLRIHHDAEPFHEITPELFLHQFGPDLAQLENRQCFLQDELGRVVGTGTAWMANQREGELWGQVHWLAIMRQHQGLGLGKSLLGTVCQRLRELGHRKAYVTSSTGRLPAIGLYLQFGFQPVIRNETEQEIWDFLQLMLKERGRVKQARVAA
jgi:GNAT superfamily N-acetyltransferase